MARQSDGRMAMSYQERMVERLLADQRRYAERLAMEDAELSGIKVKRQAHDPYLVSRSITGEPKEHHRQHKANVSSWTRMERPTWSDVKVTTSDGIVVDNVPVGAFKPSRVRDVRRDNLSEAAQRRAEQLDSIARASAAAQAALGNIE